MMAALPLLLIPRCGLVGAAIANFIGYLAYAVFMVAVARKRSGRWLSLRTLGLFAAASAILILAQSLARAYPGMYWGAIPTALVATGCAWMYFRVLADQNDE